MVLHYSVTLHVCTHLKITTKFFDGFLKIFFNFLKFCFQISCRCTRSFHTGHNFEQFLQNFHAWCGVIQRWILTFLEKINATQSRIGGTICPKTIFQDYFGQLLHLHILSEFKVNFLTKTSFKIDKYKFLNSLLRSLSYFWKVRIHFRASWSHVSHVSLEVTTE